MQGAADSPPLGLPFLRWPARSRQLVSTLEGRAHWALVGLPVFFNLWVLRAEPTVVPEFNDSSNHLAMVQWAREQIDQGRVPLDGWYPYLSMGQSHFHHYQSLPHIIAAYVSLLTGVETVFFWSLYLLLAAWPLSVFFGARLLGWDRWTAGFAALVSPLLVSVTSYGYEHTSYMWWGLGMWSQLWAMWLLPVAWGLTWRAVSGRGSYALGALALGLTVACHFLTGYLAVLSLGVWALIGPSELVKRVARVLIVGLGAFLIASWVLVPLASDSAYQINTIYMQNTFWDDSFGAPKVLRWLFTGQIYDSGRLPVVTLLVGAGLAWCLLRARHDERARALIGVWLLSLLLFFGRPTLGPLLKLLPGSDDVLFHRYLMGVHMAGIVLAGVGAVWLARGLVTAVRRFAPSVRPQLAGVAAGLAAVLILGPAWSQVAAYDQQSIALKASQHAAESADGVGLRTLIEAARNLGGGRIYAGNAATWGKQYTVGFVPAFNEIENNYADGVGFTLRTSSLMTDTEVQFDDRNPAQYDLFNIRYLILPSNRAPNVKAQLVMTQGRHSLWRVDTTGYLAVVDTVGPAIQADRRDIGRAGASFLTSTQLLQNQYPTVAFAGNPAAPPTLPAGAVASGPAGSVLVQSSSPDNGIFSGQVVANRVSVVLLKATFDPRWKVTLDGLQVPTEMIAPAYVGVQVAPGKHSITFQYVPYPQYPLLFAVGLLALLVLVFGPRLGTRRPRREAVIAPTTEPADLGLRWKGVTPDDGPVEVSIVMPCLNEAETLAGCIHQAQAGIVEHELSAEIIVADNGSTDGSIEIAERMGARVVHIPSRGYGSALRGGIAAARGRYVIMADADLSYDFTAIHPFVEKLRQGNDLVMGNRFTGRIEEGAMPWLHRWLGNPVLTRIGRLFFGARIGDFHCGLRAFSKTAIEQLGLRTSGMEFASEMVVKAALHGLVMTELPAVLRKDGRSRPPHLRTWHDGWRHLSFLLLFSPRWLFLMPGLALFCFGVLGMAWLIGGPRRVGPGALDIHTLLVAGFACLVGFQLVVFAAFTKAFAMREGFHPCNRRALALFRHVKLETGLVLGLSMTLLGGFLLLLAVWSWGAVGFGALDPQVTMRQVVPALVLMALGVQTIFASFFMSILGIPTAQNDGWGPVGSLRLPLAVVAVAQPNSATR